jgi:2-keto-myo-inositol isomerase
MAEFPLCLNTSTIRPAPLLEKVAIAGRLGFDAIEPWNDEVDAYLATGGTLEELRSAIADAGLRVVSMIALKDWIDSEGDALTAALDDCARRMDQAAALGSPFIVASPPHGPVDLRRAADRYADLLRLGRAHGVRPAMEFLGFVQTVNTVDAALAIADGANDTDATVVADVFHLLRGGGSLDDLLKIRADRLAIFHINDLPASPPATEQTDADRVMVGDGIADLPRVIADLRTIGYRGPLSLELFNPSLWEEDPEEVCRIGMERIRALVEA